MTLIHFSCKLTTLPGSVMTQHVESPDFGSLCRFPLDRWKFERLFVLEYECFSVLTTTGREGKWRKGSFFSLCCVGVKIQTEGIWGKFSNRFFCLTHIFYLWTIKKAGLRLIYCFFLFSFLWNSIMIEILSRGWMAFFFIIIISFYPGDSYSLAVWDKEIRFQEREGIPASADVW